jgi:hypothetical protein
MKTKLMLGSLLIAFAFLSAYVYGDKYFSGTEKGSVNPNAVESQKNEATESAKEEAQQHQDQAAEESPKHEATESAKEEAEEQEGQEAEEPEDENGEESQKDGSTESQDQKDIEQRDSGSGDVVSAVFISCPVLTADFQECEVISENGSMSKDGATESSSQTMSKDQGTTDTEQMLRNAGVSEDRIHQWHGIFNAPFYTNSPAFLLGMQDTLALTADQKQQLTTLNEQTLTKARQILTDEQRSKLSKLPSQTFTLKAIHQEICKKMQTHMEKNSQNKNCEMTCPMCPSESQKQGSSE